MDPWPFRHLVLRTPRLELRPDDDEGLLELVEEAHHGIHPPDQMPFGVGWSDTPAEDLGRTMLQHHWRVRAELTAAKWTLNFLVRFDGRVIGTQGIGAEDFAVTGEVHTGSWVGLRHQGKGIGTEMRAAVLVFAFDHLGATRARSSAWSENAKSLGVSRKLGYVDDGTQRVTRRGQASDDVRLLLTHDRFIRPAWTLEVAGSSGCLGLLTQGEPAE
ncbi:GNAT family N-acetyltransferase [Umezawaea tangerina]|uniref:RimJ/RimL family protein N-acetyltransferase n=1 Tax=Umezawaea tangerina TaxID=84725 RepID=A0A2T0TKD1_9PSEU|nr:GNAT family N-acetyltransferase [Umezawaea tangerina]PRY46071.1 RimJ/RimL family protein N-acetyltransferase [Umezawaea tangerina]